MLPLPRVFIAFLFDSIDPAIFREVTLLFSPSALSPFGCEPFLEIFLELFSLFSQILRKKTISIVFPLPESPKPDFFVSSGLYALLPAPFYFLRGRSAFAFEMKLCRFGESLLFEGPSLLYPYPWS